MAFNFGAGKPVAPAPGEEGESKSNAGAVSSGFLNRDTGTIATGSSPGGYALTATDSGAVFAVSEFADMFPFIDILVKIRSLDAKLSSPGREAQYAAQELAQLLRTTDSLSNPPPPVFTPPNDSIRQQLRTNPNVILRQSIAAFSPKMLEQVFSIADTLHVSEQDAVTLFAKASQPATLLFFRDNERAKIDLTSVTNVACALYFRHRIAMLQTLLLLSQFRIEQKHLEATDALLSRNLITNLVNLSRSLSILIAQVRPQEANLSRSMLATAMETQSVEEKYPWVDHLNQERQLVAECLFYLTYNSQCTAPEVSLLIDLIHELTNVGLSELDAVRDVPDAYHPQAYPMAQWGPFVQALPPLREKTNQEWECELVTSVWKRDEPYVLQCVSVLLMAVLCALDTQQTLLNRDTHSANDFGVGNALFRFLDSTSSVDDIAPIHQRLEVAASEHWKRKDVWGVMAAAYALALRPVSAVLASPRAQPGSSSSMIKRTWMACLTSPSDCKSFTFIRHTLVPSLSNNIRKSERCELHSFLLSVLTEFMSKYLDVVSVCNAIPFSRSKWQDNEVERLSIARQEQERNRSFFQSYGGVYEERFIPSEVDLVQRPDCIDDIVAVAIDLCSYGSEYAARFWSSEELRLDNDCIQSRLVASRALKTLEILQEKDDSLIPVYLSFLAALAIAEPSIVFEILNRSEGTFGKSFLSWRSLFDTLRWYVRKFSGNPSVESKPATSKEVRNLGASSYYYGVDDTSNTAGFSPYNSLISANVPSSVQLDELREANTAIVMSHLALITKVATSYPRGRATLATMKISLEGNLLDEEGDSVLLVLFSLAISPLSPQVRGAVFATIASLLRLEGADSDDQRQICELARKGWDLLELSQVVPVCLLEQYQMKSSTESASAMSFPPSSLSLASGEGVKAFSPADPKFGILFEMEHVESRLGSYPSTEGLLLLLSSLVCAAGCPSDLGSSSLQNNGGRIRAGSSPYIEFVAYFVLPRAVGSQNGDDRLYFKRGGDSSRLVARALEVVEAVVSRYYVPSSPSVALTYADEIQKHEKELGIASSLLRMPWLAENVMLIPTEGDVGTFEKDFESAANVAPFSETGIAVSLPRLKSPGFVLIADILSTIHSELLKTIAVILRQDGGCEGIHDVVRQRDHLRDIVWALFGDIVPSISTAKFKYENASSFERQSLLRPLLPLIDVHGDLYRSADSVHWRVKSISMSLKILAGAASKERSFVDAFGAVVTIVPALRFNQKLNVISKNEVSLTSVRDAFLGNAPLRLLPSVTQYLSPIASDDTEDSEISGNALALLAYCSEHASGNTILSALGCLSIAAERHFAREMATRLAISSKRTDRPYDYDILRVILDLLQSDLAHVLLGFPHTSLDGVDSPGFTSAPQSFEEYDCLSVLLDRLADDEFLVHPTSSSFASQGFKIVFNLISENDESALGRQRSSHLTKCLNARDFWNDCALRFLAARESGHPSILRSLFEGGTGILLKGASIMMHGAAWFFRALAVHFERIREHFVHEALSSQNQRLLSNLLDRKFHLLQNAIDCVPPRNDDKIFPFPQTLLPFQSLIDSCTVPVIEHNDYYPGMMIVKVGILKKKIDHYGASESEKNRAIAWAEDWNEFLRRDCAAAHISLAISALIEAAFDYSNWSIMSGVSGVAQSSLEMIATRELSLLYLLDRIVDRLLRDGDTTVASMRDRLPSSSINLCNAVLLLVTRITSSFSQLTFVAHFICRIGSATISSLEKSGSASGSSADEDDERSVLLGSSLVKLLQTENIELSDHAQEILRSVALGFAGLSCQPVSSPCADRRKAMISVVARSIIASLIGYLDNVGNTTINPIVESLTMSQVSRVYIHDIIQLIPALDDNVCLLIESIACSEGGTKALLRFGVIDALVSAFRKFFKTPERSLGGNVDSFLVGNMRLMRTLMASDALSDFERDDVCEQVRYLLVSFSSIFVEVGAAFPMFGDCWLEIVKTLAMCLRRRNSRTPHVLVRADQFKEPNPEGARQLEKLTECLIGVTMNIAEFPFPDRFLSKLPVRLRAAQTAPIWWDVIEQQHLSTTSNERSILPDPPAGLSFGWAPLVGDRSSNEKFAWSAEKYEACLTAALVTESSLTFILDHVGHVKSHEIVVSSASLARGLCRYTDSSRGISQRLKDIEKGLIPGAIPTFVNVRENKAKEMISIERRYLEEMCPVFGRCCEKLLMLADSLFERMRSFNEESYRGLPSAPSLEMTIFAQDVSLALQYTRLAHVGVSSGCSDVSNFSTMIAKKIEDALASVQNSSSSV